MSENRKATRPPPRYVLVAAEWFGGVVVVPIDKARSWLDCRAYVRRSTAEALAAFDSFDMAQKRAYMHPAEMHWRMMQGGAP